jgi:hypothetical protein
MLRHGKPGGPSLPELYRLVENGIAARLFLDGPDSPITVSTHRQPGMRLLSLFTRKPRIVFFSRSNRILCLLRRPQGLPERKRR